jgi:hypothetical protein
MLTKTKYRQRCQLVAHQAAENKIPVGKIPYYLSKLSWFMEMQGLTPDRKFSPGGGIFLFGRAWCDKCMNEELFKTGLYTKEEIESIAK